MFLLHPFQLSCQAPLLLSVNVLVWPVFVLRSPSPPPVPLSVDFCVCVPDLCDAGQRWIVTWLQTRHVTPTRHPTPPRYRTEGHRSAPWTAPPSGQSRARFFGGTANPFLVLRQPTVVSPLCSNSLSFKFFPHCPRRGKCAAAIIHHATRETARRNKQQT